MCIQVAPDQRRPSLRLSKRDRKPGGHSRYLPRGISQEHFWIGWLQAYHMSISHEHPDESNQQRLEHDMHGAHTHTTLFQLQSSYLLPLPWWAASLHNHATWHHRFRSTISAGSVPFFMYCNDGSHVSFWFAPKYLSFFCFFQQNSHYHYHQHLQHHQIVSIIMGSKTLKTIALINCCNLSMPHHAMQPHHHHRIQTANPKKQKQWVHTHTPHTHTYYQWKNRTKTTHHMILPPRSPSLSTCVCVRLCVWIQGKISILPAGVKNPGLPPLHSDTRSEESTWEPLMWE